MLVFLCLCFIAMVTSFVTVFFCWGLYIIVAHPFIELFKALITKKGA
jgi:hypothetical protein